MRRATLIVLLGGLLAGCGGGSKSASQDAVVNWVPHPPPAPAAVARACRAADLRARPALQGGTGGLVGIISLRNASARPCSLSGTPTVKLTPALPQTYTRIKPAPPELPATWLHSLSGRRGASFQLVLFNWCFPKKTPTMVVTLPRGRGKLAFPLHEAPRCIVAATPTTVSVGPFQPAVSVGPPFTPLALGARIVPAAPTAQAGKPLRYDVQLTNRSKSTLHFGPCPLVRQQLGATSRIDVLNCRPAGDIEPGHSVGFRMELPLAPEASLGPQILRWTLDPFSSRPVRATAQAQG